MGTDTRTLEALVDREYKWGFVTEIDADAAPKGLNEDIIRLISTKKNEPEFMLEWRLKAYGYWSKLEKEQAEPKWANIKYGPIDYQDIVYYSAPKSKKEGPKSLDEVDPEILRAYEKLGIPLLVQKYLGSVVPYTDNFFASLNSAVFTDGSFVYVPKGVRCPMELLTYFRINAAETGQFERTLIIADEGAYVSYLEGCTAPIRDKNQLHAAVVELIAHDNAEIKYSTVQNWYPGDPETGKGGLYNFATKSGKCAGVNSKISWTQVETGSAITWKYPSVILQGDNSVGEFYSVALTNNW